MKLVTFSIATPLGDQERIGIMRDRSVIDLVAVYETILARRGVYSAAELAQATITCRMRDFLSRWPVAKAAAVECVAFWEQHQSLDRSPGGARLGYRENEYRLSVPVRPTRLKDYLTYEDHKRKGFAKLGLPLPKEWFLAPTYTNRNLMGLAGPDEDIRWPSYTEKFDFEFEIAAVIGKAGRNIRAEDAFDYIAGFTIYNDFSARDTQQEERANGSGPGKSKDFDQGNVLGPCIVTADELAADNIDMILRVNGEQWSRGNTSDMKFSWGQIIEHASREETIYPGDVIASGTMNNGSCLELERWFGPGDVIEMEATGIGVLRNKIIRP